MKSITILLIEDNPSDARLIREMLKDISHFKSNLISALTLKEGCEQIQKNIFDIILLDLNLPDSIGRQTFHKVIDCSKETPIILITGVEDNELSLKLIVEGAQDYITKQSLNSDLLEKSIFFSIERQALLKNIKIQNVQIDRIEKERILLAKFPSQNPGPILRVAGNGKLLYINEAGIKLLPDWQLIINEIIPSRLKDIIDPIFIEGTNIEFELCHHELIYSFYAVPFIEEGYINLYGRDITEHKRAESTLRESEERLRDIINSIADWVWEVDENGVYTYSSQKGFDCFGPSREDVIGKTPFDFMPPDEAKRVAAIFSEIATNKALIKDLENWNIMKNGERICLLTNGVPILDKAGNLKGYRGVDKDITERRRAEQELIIANKELLFQNEEKEKRATELNENKTLLASILDSSLSGIMAFKSIRNAEGAIMDFEWQLVNAAAEQMVNHSQTEILGMRLLEEMPGNRVEGLFDLYAQVVETGIPLSHEHYYEHEKVKTWFHTVAIKRLDGFVVTFSNITERKLAEQELIIANKELLFQNEEKEKRAAELIIANKELLFQNEEKEKRAAELIKAWEKAKENDNLKSAFLRNLSHEIRTPMNQILGFASLLKDSDLTEVMRDEYIGIINSQSHQLLHIITDIVEISKITAGQIDLKLDIFNLGVMMDELLASFKPKAEHRNLQLSLNKKIADTDALIRGDQVKLNQIFSNLIENAIKFTNAGSVDIEYSKAGDRLIITVKDTGIGIEEQEKQVIFDHFRQIEITTMRQYGGLGLGLSISNAYIRMMSGVIRVESEPGEGSTFFVEIPYLPAVCISESTMNVLQTPDIYRPDWQDKTLLIAEDEESNMYYLQEVLRSTGIHFLFAVNGLEAVEQCKIHPEIALVLMDMRMPRMDGIEATKIIKSFRNDLPVIATTAFAIASEKEYILDAGCNDYISKPIKKDELLALIQKHLNKLEID